MAPEHREILAALLGDPDVVVTDAEFLIQGWTNINYRVHVTGQDLALRICAAAPVSAMRRRHELELLCGRAQDLAPELLGYQLPHGHLLTRFVSRIRCLNGRTAGSRSACLSWPCSLHTSLGDLRRRYDPRRQIETNLMRARDCGLSGREGSCGRRPEPEARYPSHGGLP